MSDRVTRVMEQEVRSAHSYRDPTRSPDDVWVIARLLRVASMHIGGHIRGSLRGWLTRCITSFIPHRVTSVLSAYEGTGLPSRERAPGSAGVPPAVVHALAWARRRPPAVVQEQRERVRQRFPPNLSRYI